MGIPVEERNFVHGWPRIQLPWYCDILCCSPPPVPALSHGAHSSWPFICDLRWAKTKLNDQEFFRTGANRWVNISARQEWVEEHTIEPRPSAHKVLPTG